MNLLGLYVSIYNLWIHSRMRSLKIQLLFGTTIQYTIHLQSTHLFYTCIFYYSRLLLPQYIVLTLRLIYLARKNLNIHQHNSDLQNREKKNRLKLLLLHGWEARVLGVIHQSRRQGIKSIISTSDGDIMCLGGFFIAFSEVWTIWHYSRLLCFILIFGSSSSLARPLTLKVHWLTVERYIQDSWLLVIPDSTTTTTSRLVWTWTVMWGMAWGEAVMMFWYCV